MIYFLPALLFAFSIQAQSNFVPADLIVNATSLKLRSMPDATDGQVLEVLPSGTRLAVIDVYNNGEVLQVDSFYAPWYKVRTKKGNIGFVFGAFVSGAYNIYYENEITFEPHLPRLNWYGVYMRDSFSDELRPIKVRLATENMEYYGEEVKIIKTDQKEQSKFLLATLDPLPTGYCGPLGITDSPGWFFEGGLAPGAMVPISAGQAPNDTTIGETYFLAATGCAQLKDNYVQVTNYQLFAMTLGLETSQMQDLTAYVTAEPGLNPFVTVQWYGDLDHDHLPDAVIHDCPIEMGCRSSLYLSSKAESAELIRKVCEHFWYGD